MAESPEIKSGSEALKWVLLFQRVGRSFAGLLLLEIGWVLLLALAAKLTQEGETPVLGIPGFLRLKRPLLDIANVPETTVWVVGALLIVFGWVLYSRFSHYLITPVVLLSKLLLALGFLFLWIVAIALTILLLPLTIPLERWQLRVRLKQVKAKWISKNAPDSAPDVGEAAYAKWAEGFSKKHGPKMLETRELEKIAFKPELLVIGLRRIQQKFLLPIYSGIRIGVAPVTSQAGSEDISVARIPFSNLAGLTVAVRALLDDLGLSAHVTFYTLPAIFRISTERQARFMRWFFALEVLAWGGYMDEDGQTVWLKFQGRLSGLPELDHEDPGLSYEGRLFPGTYGGFKLEVPAVSFSSHSGEEAFHALLLAIFEAVQQRIHRENSRRRAEWPKSMRWLQRLLQFFRELVQPDQGWQLSEVSDRFIRHLIFVCFGRLCDQSVADTYIPSATSQLTRLAGNWVGHQFCQYRSSDGWKDVPQEHFLQQLYWLTQRSTKIVPESPEHFYRLGALCCVLGDKNNALQAFHHASERDRLSHQIDRTSAPVLAEMALREADREVLLQRKLAVARFAAHAVRSIYVRARSADEIRKLMENSSTIVQAKLNPAEESAAITAAYVIDELLEGIKESTTGD